MSNYLLELSDDALERLESLRTLLPDVRAFVRDHTPKHWPMLTDVIESAMDEPLEPPAVLPLASCSAVGGDPAAAVPVSAAWTVLGMAIRVLDDVQDQDRSDALWAQVGPARAFNLSAGLFSLSLRLLAEGYEPEVHQRLARVFTGEGLRLAAGQDRDLQGAAPSLEEHWQTFEEKNARAFVLACEAGAHCGTQEPSSVRACAQYGLHLGNVLQVFDDVQGLWAPDGVGDLAIEKATLPLYYGLSFEHDDRDRLAAWKDAGVLHENAPAVVAILDRLDARAFMMWTALQERTRAYDALVPCPGVAGTQALRAYVTVPFAELESLVQPIALG
ncbi:MAG: polyprenyl synthetase family protein [Rhodothermales bacterium]